MSYSISPIAPRLAAFAVRPGGRLAAFARGGQHHGSRGAYGVGQTDDLMSSILSESSARTAARTTAPAPTTPAPTAPATHTFGFDSWFGRSSTTTPPSGTPAPSGSGGKTVQQAPPPRPDAAKTDLSHFATPGPAQQWIGTQIPLAPQSNALTYVAIGGAVVAVAVIVMAMRQTPRATAAAPAAVKPNGRRKRKK